MYPVRHVTVTWRTELGKFGNGATLTVKRVNRKTITDTHGETWPYADIMPLNPDGTGRTTAQAVAAFRTWTEQETTHA